MQAKGHILLKSDYSSIETFEAFKADGGLEGLEKARAMAPQELINVVKNANLRGRGGAGFPTWIKWNGILNEPAERKFVACNFSEGEPGTYKDRFVCSKNPYLGLAGILIAKHATQAEKAYIGMKGKYKLQLSRMREAMKDFIAAGVMQEGDVELVEGPDDYLFGEERALVSVINGIGALPTIMPTYMQGIGATSIGCNPTVVNNFETMCHLSGILKNGPDWFKSLGTVDTPGTTVFTLCGDIKNPGMYELPLGLTLRELLYEIGGGPVGEYPIKAVFSGVANTVITPDMFDTVLDFGSLRAVGTGLGSSGLIVYDESVSMVKVAILLSGFLAKESCGQCNPCKSGTRLITDMLWKIENGEADEEDLETIRVACGQVNRQTRCFLSHEESILIGSVLRKFDKEFKDHLGRKSTLPRIPFMAKIKSFDEATKQFTYEDYDFYAS